MAKGRKRKSDAKRELDGQSSRELVATARYEVAPGGCPQWLADTHPLASECWDALAPLLNQTKAVQQLDGVALTMLVEVYAEWREASVALADEGTYISSENARGGWRTYHHPAVTQRQDAFRRLHSMITEFGMTPASRGKVEPADGPGTDPFDDL